MGKSENGMEAKGEGWEGEEKQKRDFGIDLVNRSNLLDQIVYSALLQLAGTALASSTLPFLGIRERCGPGSFPRSLTTTSSQD